MTYDERHRHEQHRHGFVLACAAGVVVLVLWMLAHAAWNACARAYRCRKLARPPSPSHQALARAYSADIERQNRKPS